MMATTNLINVNVDQIFEQNNIGEIDVINRKIQAEIELKKENLRTMVLIKNIAEYSTVLLIIQLFCRSVSDIVT